MMVSFEGGQTFSNSPYVIVNGQTRRIETFGYTVCYTLLASSSSTLVATS